MELQTQDLTYRADARPPAEVDKHSVQRRVEAVAQRRLLAMHRRFRAHEEGAFHETLEPAVGEGPESLLPTRVVGISEALTRTRQ
jgi:hypothetical protein